MTNRNCVLSLVPELLSGNLRLLLWRYALAGFGLW